MALWIQHFSESVCFQGIFFLNKHGPFLKILVPYIRRCFPNFCLKKPCYDFPLVVTRLVSGFDSISLYLRPKITSWIILCYNWWLNCRNNWRWLLLIEHWLKVSKPQHKKLTHTYIIYETLWKTNHQWDTEEVDNDKEQCHWSLL